MTPDTPSSTDVIPSALPPRGSQRGQTRCRSCSSSCRRTSTGPFQHPRICFVTASSAWLWPESSARPEPSWDPTLASDPASRPRRRAAQPGPAACPARPSPAPKAGPAPGASPPPAQRRADLPRQLPQLNLLRSLGWFALTENFVYSPLCSELYPLLTLLRARGRRSRTRQSGGKARFGAGWCGPVRSVQYSVG